MYWKKNLFLLLCFLLTIEIHGQIRAEKYFQQLQETKQCFLEEGILTLADSNAINDLPKSYLNINYPNGAFWFDKEVFRLYANSGNHRRLQTELDSTVQLEMAQQLQKCKLVDTNFVNYVKRMPKKDFGNRENQHSFMFEYLLRYQAFAGKGAFMLLDTLESMDVYNPQNHANLKAAYSKTDMITPAEICQQFDFFTDVDVNPSDIDSYRKGLAHFMVKYPTLGDIKSLKINYIQDSIAQSIDSTLIAISLTQNGIEYKDVYAFSQPYHLNPYSPEVTFPYQMLNQILAKQGEKKRFIAFTSSGIDGVFLLNEKQFDYIIGDKVAYSNPLWKYFMLTGLSYPFYFENEINPYQTDTLTTNILQKWVDAGLVSVHYISWMQHKLQRYDSPKFTLNKFCYAYPSDFFRRETAQIKLSKKARTAQINAMQSYIQRLKNAGLLAPSKQDDKWVKSFQPKRTITFLNKINGN